MHRFPNDCRDLYEEMFGKKLSRIFPEYASFWERYSGDRLGDIDKRSYPLDFSAATTHAKSVASAIEASLRLLRQASYQTFCSLVELRVHSARLARTRNRPLSDGIIECLDEFVTVYSRITAIVYALRQVRDRTQEITGTPKSAPGPHLSKLELRKRTWSDFVRHGSRPPHMYQKRAGVLVRDLRIPPEFDLTRKAEKTELADIHRQRPYEEWVPLAKHVLADTRLSTQACRETYATMLSMLELWERGSGIRIMRDVISAKQALAAPPPHMGGMSASANRYYVTGLSQIFVM